MSRSKFIFLFVLNLFLLGGLRTCSPFTTIGFPVVATEYNPKYTESTFDVWLSGHPPREVPSKLKIFWKGWMINAAFAGILLILLIRFTASQKWSSSLPFRVGGYTSLVYLILGNLGTFFNLILKTEGGITDSILLVIFFPWMFIIILWHNLIDFNGFIAHHPALAPYYPVSDDLTFRVIIPFALLTAFCLGWLTTKIVVKIKQKKTKPLNL